MSGRRRGAAWCPAGYYSPELVQVCDIWTGINLEILSRLHGANDHIGDRVVAHDRDRGRCGNLAIDGHRSIRARCSGTGSVFTEPALVKGISGWPGRARLGFQGQRCACRKCVAVTRRNEGAAVGSEGLVVFADETRSLPLWCSRRGLASRYRNRSRRRSPTRSRQEG